MSCKCSPFTAPLLSFTIFWPFTYSLVIAFNIWQNFPTDSSLLHSFCSASLPSSLSLPLPLSLIPLISLPSCPSLIPALLSLIYPFISSLSSPHCLHPSVPPLTVKLAKQIVHHSASFWFLIQCYLSTLVLYAGLYTLVYRFDVSEHPLHMMPTTNQCLTCSTM